MKKLLKNGTKREQDSVAEENCQARRSGTRSDVGRRSRSTARKRRLFGRLGKGHVPRCLDYTPHNVGPKVEGRGGCPVLAFAVSPAPSIGDGAPTAQTVATMPVVDEEGNEARWV